MAALEMSPPLIARTFESPTTGRGKVDLSRVPCPSCLHPERPPNVRSFVSFADLGRWVALLLLSSSVPMDLKLLPTHQPHEVRAVRPYDEHREKERVKDDGPRRGCPARHDREQRRRKQRGDGN